jgi:IS30 family transposase
LTVKDHGVSMRLPRLTADELAEIQRLYADSWSCARIGERLNRQPSVIWRSLGRAGVVLRDPHER